MERRRRRRSKRRKPINLENYIHPKIQKEKVQIVNLVVCFHEAKRKISRPRSGGSNDIFYSCCIH